MSSNSALGNPSNSSLNILGWRYAIAGFFFVFVILIKFFFGAASNLRAFESIEQGMTMSQVLEVMGPADKKLPDGRGTTKLYWQVKSLGSDSGQRQTYHFYVQISDEDGVIDKSKKVMSTRY